MPHIALANPLPYHRDLKPRLGGHRVKAAVASTERDIDATNLAHVPEEEDYEGGDSLASC